MPIKELIELSLVNLKEEFHSPCPANLKLK
jgi:hypothetical protein